MRKLQKIGLFLIVAGAICTTACSDDDETTAPELTAEQKISGNSFLLIDQVQIENGVTVSTYDSLDVCDKDDVIIFNANKTGAFDEGVTKCDPQDNQSDPFNWGLLADTKLRIIDSDNDTLDVDIVKNDGTNLSVQFTEDDGTDVYVFTSTYVKQ